MRREATSSHDAFSRALVVRAQSVHTVHAQVVLDLDKFGWGAADRARLRGSECVVHANVETLLTYADGRPRAPLYAPASLTPMAPD